MRNTQKTPKLQTCFCAVTLKTMCSPRIQTHPNSARARTKKRPISLCLCLFVCISMCSYVKEDQEKDQGPVLGARPSVRDHSSLFSLTSISCRKRAIAPVTSCHT